MTPGRAAYLRLRQQAPRSGVCFLHAEAWACHRVWDSIDGDRASVATLATAYGIPPAEVRDVRLAYRWAREQHRAMPGRRG
jgi:hypothetical protein